MRFKPRYAGCTKSFADVTEDDDGQIWTRIDEIDLGRWYDVPVLGEGGREKDDEDIRALEESVLNLPLVPRTKIIVDLDYDGAIGFKDVLKDRNNTIFRETYPHDNPIFTGLNMTRKRTPYRFEARYPKIGQLSNREEQARKIPKVVRDRYIHRVEGSERLGKKLFFRNSEAFLTYLFGDLEPVLTDLFNFVRKHSSLEEHEEPNVEYDMGYLISEFLKTGKFPGDCKSVSTFTVGLANSIGLPARRLSGDMLYTRDYEAIKARHEREIAEAPEMIERAMKRRERSLEKHDLPEGIKQVLRGFTRSYEDKLDGFIRMKKQELEELEPGTTHELVEGHTWPEIYVPTKYGKGVWFLLDPGHFMGEYPKGDNQYRAEAVLPNFMHLGLKPLRFRVNYREL